MSASALRRALGEPLAVLFVFIGWTEKYDGTQLVVGSHEWLQGHPDDNWEMNAFKPGRDGTFRCGVGRGAGLPARAHIVFVARDPGDGLRKVVGVYAAARFDQDGGYPRASTRLAQLVPARERTELTGWPGAQGVRRWAFRGGSEGVEHPELLRWFEQFKDTHAAPPPRARPHEDQVYSDLTALEGALRLRMERHRTREAKMRDAKIAEALARDGASGLSCEVPGCGFNFAEAYGVLGNGYAQVHHVNPLARAGIGGQSTSLQQLRIVCANCHAMIHRGGESRELAEVSPKRAKG